MGAVRILITIVLMILGGWLAFAQERSALPLPMLELRLDIRNLISDSGKEKISEQQLTNLIERVNEVYSQCQVRFVTRKVLEIPASSLEIPFPPQSEEDMTLIATKIHPHGFSKTEEAFPLTIAGEFGFFAPAHQVNLFALTWVWLNGPSDISRMHSMIARQRLEGSQAAEIIVHELGHFFLLQHTGVGENIMASGFGISAEQCTQIRSITATYYQSLLTH
jgi:hypothetical protein